MARTFNFNCVATESTSEESRSNPERARNLSLLQSVQPALAPVQFLIQLTTAALSPGEERFGCVTERSLHLAPRLLVELHLHSPLTSWRACEQLKLYFTFSTLKTSWTTYAKVFVFPHLRRDAT